MAVIRLPIGSLQDIKYIKKVKKGVNKVAKVVRSWKDIIGNESKKEMIINAISRDVLPSFVLFTGNSGIGKSTFAKMTAKTILCRHKNELGEPCLECEICKGVDNETIESYKKINMPTLFKKAEITSTIEEIFKIKKISSKTVYVLEEIHGLNEDLQEMFLEELTKIPKDVWIISCTTRQYKLLPEILNRALEIKLLNPTEKECIRYTNKLAQEYGVSVISPEAVNALAERCEYNPRKISEVIRVVATDNRLTEESIANLFEVIPDSIMYRYLDTLLAKDDVYDFMNSLAEIQQEHSLYQVNKQAMEILYEYIIISAGRIASAKSISPILKDVLSTGLGRISPKKSTKILSMLAESGLKENESKVTQRIKLATVKARIENLLAESILPTITEIEKKSVKEPVANIQKTNLFEQELKPITAASELESLLVSTGFGDDL